MFYRSIVVLLLSGLAAAAIASESKPASMPDNGELKAKIQAGEEKAKQACASCHGPDGNSANPDFPVLAGQVPGYIAEQLQRFKSGARDNAIMKGIVGGLSDEDMAALDLYFANQSAKGGAIPEGDVNMAKKGEHVYRGGFGPMNVSACMSCHGPSGHGVPRRYPRVAGQHRKYLEQQLLAFKTGKRTSDGDIMTNIAFRLSEQQIKELAAFMHALQ